MNNFKAFNFALIYYNKYGFVGAFKEYKRQRQQLRDFRVKLDDLVVREEAH